MWFVGYPTGYVCTKKHKSQKILKSRPARSWLICDFLFMWLHRRFHLFPDSHPWSTTNFFAFSKIAVLDPLQKVFIERNAPKQTPKIVSGHFCCSGACFWSCSFGGSLKRSVYFFGRHDGPFSVSFEENNFLLGGTNTFWSKMRVPLRSRKWEKMHQIDTAVGTRGFMRGLFGRPG